MDGETARHIIRVENQAARELLRAGLIEKGREAETLAEALRPWAEGRRVSNWREWRPPDRAIGPELFRALSAAYQWRNIRPLTGRTWHYDHFKGERPVYPEIDGDEIPILAKDLSNPGARYLGGAIDSTVCLVHDGLKYCAQFCRDARPPEVVLVVPDEVHPPRHGRLNDGVLARLLTEDLINQIKAGRAMEAALAAGEPVVSTVHDWCRDVAGVLAGLTPEAGQGFAYLISDSVACESQYIADASTLRRAYLALALAYLEEVQERMPDYAEASGQEPRVSMSISGNTIYGGQFGAQIANIDSTIAGVAQQGSREVADALKALEQAVLSQEGLDEEQRRDLLDNVGYLAEAAETPPGQRNRGIIKSVLSALSLAATSGDDLNRTMETWGGVLHGLMP
ncbi:hypothetical protein ACFWZ2_13470 [Streptomyces sp. NPDC059002]|uniref:hypothetical protein n=1 Tax=Streptomyces sp. NPDC059002 TaxID=3346690 RepID=UPI0036AD0A6B